MDGNGRTTINEQFGTRPDGIEFRRDGFVGSGVDWSDIDMLRFRQEWSAAGTAPLDYLNPEIRAVPVHKVTLVTGLGAGLVTRRVRSRRCG